MKISKSELFNFPAWGGNFPTSNLNNWETFGRDANWGSPQLTPIVNPLATSLATCTGMMQTQTLPMAIGGGPVAWGGGSWDKKLVEVGKEAAKYIVKGVKAVPKPQTVIPTLVYGGAAWIVRHRDQILDQILQRPDFSLHPHTAIHHLVHPHFHNHPHTLEHHELHPHEGYDHG